MADRDDPVEMPPGRDGGAEQDEGVEVEPGAEAEAPSAKPDEAAPPLAVALPSGAWHEVEPDFQGARPFLTLDELRVERGPPGDAFVLEIDRLRIPAGSFTAVLGGSGIGKTTLLTVLGLLRGPRDEPDLRMRCKRFALAGRDGEGEAAVYEELTEDGARVELAARERERLRREWIGFCLQGGELVPSLTLADNCAVPAHLCSLPDAEARATTHLRSLGMVDSAIGNQLGKLPGELSGGQRQRGVVARALAHSPRMVLLDEPTAALDRGTAEEAIGLLRTLAREHGQTVIMVTHDRALAEAYADFIIELDLVKKKHSRIARCRARMSVDDAQEAAPPRPVERATAPEPTSWRYHVHLGLMDAIGPWIHVLRRRKQPQADPSPPPGAVGGRFLLHLLQNSAVVVAIAMLVLFLRGMRSGLIEDFRTALRKSPTARKIALFGTFLAEDLDRLAAAHPRIESVVPVATPKAGLSVATAQAPPPDDSPLSRVTLNGLVQGDPTNALLDPDVDFDAMEPDHLVLSAAAAGALGVEAGDPVRVWAQRHLDEFGETAETQSTVLRVFCVLPGVERSIGAAWVHFGFTRAISRFQAGVPVTTDGIDWPGVTKRLMPRYAAFLLFVRSKEPGPDALSRADRDLLRRKSFAVDVLPDAERDDLLGRVLLPADALAALNAGEEAAGRAPHPPLTVLRLTSQRGDPLRASQLRVEGALRSGGLLVPWNPPLDVRLADGRALRLGGFALQRNGNWLRPYLRGDLPRIFKWDDTSWDVLVADGASDDGPRRIALSAGDPPVSIDLDGLAVPASADAAPWGLVASPLLGRLHALARGEARADPERKVIFRRNAREEFGQVHVFPDDVFSVPDILKTLEDAGYRATANTNQLREVQGYTRVLGTIVRVTSILAAIIALLTIGIVFHDVGRSKKRMLATLRIMGLTRGGAFTLLMVRGVLVALIAGLLLLVVGSVGSGVLNALAGRRLCLLDAGDFVAVILGILAVCIAGTYFPARAVSRTEPVVALQEAEQQG